ncbi:MAG: hypothetical protein WAK94_00225 [Steroidobacteraceae bacterium]
MNATPALRRWAVSTAAACVLGAAVGLTVASGSRPLQYLDETTGATVVAVARPLVFAHERSTFGRDLVTVAAAAVDQSGKVSYILVAYFWSTGVPVDRPVAPDRLILQADGERIGLARLSQSARDAGIGQPVHHPPFGTTTPYAYGIDLPTVQRIAASHDLELYLQGDSARLSYRLLEDGRRSLEDWVRFLGDQH